MGQLLGGIKKKKINRPDKIILQTDEIDDVLSKFYLGTIGEDSMKLIKESDRETVHWYNSKELPNYLYKRQSVQQNKPIFSNVVPLIPIVAQEVMERNEIDLVDMRSLEDRCPGTEFKYVLSVEDVFSRYMFLRLRRTKTSDEVARELEEIYQDFQTP